MDLCKQAKNLHSTVTERTRPVRQSEPECEQGNKKGHYSLQCRSRQEPTCYRCNKKSHYAIECFIRPVPLVSCNYCHRKGHRAEYFFVRQIKEAVDEHDVRILRKNSSDDSSNNDLAKGDCVIFVELEDNETEAAFKRSANSETLTKQQRC